MQEQPVSQEREVGRLTFAELSHRWEYYAPRPAPVQLVGAVNTTTLNTAAPRRMLDSHWPASLHLIYRLYI